LLNAGIAKLLNEALNFIGVNFGRLHICLQRWCGIGGVIENLLIIPGQRPRTMVLRKEKKSVLVPRKACLPLDASCVSLLTKGLVGPTYKGQL